MSIHPDPSSIVGLPTLGSPLNAIQQANAFQQLALTSYQNQMLAAQNALMPSISALAQWQAFDERYQREKFYRSCSQNWLNAMLDVELGLHR